MTESYKCIKEAVFADMQADIKILNKNVDVNEKKIDRLNVKSESQNELSTAISVMSITLEHIVEHNKRQDTMMENQNHTLENINDNLSQLNAGYDNLNIKVEKLEQRVDTSERKSTIDLRDIEKDKYIDMLIKYAIPFSVGGGIVYVLLEVIKVFKG